MAERNSTIRRNVSQSVANNAVTDSSNFIVVLLSWIIGGGNTANTKRHSLEVVTKSNNLADTLADI